MQLLNINKTINMGKEDMYSEVLSKLLETQQQLVLNQQRSRVPNPNDFLNFEQYANEFYMVCSHLNSPPEDLIELCTQQLRGPALEAALLYKEFNVTTWNQFVHYMIRMVDGNNLQRNIDERSVTQYSTPGRNFTAYALKKYRIAKLHCHGCTEKGLLNIVLMNALPPIRRYLTPKVDNDEITTLEQLITTAQEVDDQLNYYRESFNNPMNSTPPKFNQSHHAHMSYHQSNPPASNELTNTVPKSIEQPPNPTHQHHSNKPYQPFNQRHSTKSHYFNKTTPQQDQITINKILSKYQVPSISLEQPTVQPLPHLPPPKPVDIDSTEIDEPHNVYMLQVKRDSHCSTSDEKVPTRKSKNDLTNQLKNLLKTAENLIKKAEENDQLDSTEEENSSPSSMDEESDSYDSTESSFEDSASEVEDVKVTIAQINNKPDKATIGEKQFTTPLTVHKVSVGNHTANALLDNCATSSFIEKKLAKKLKLTVYKTKKGNTSIFGFGAKELGKTYSYVQLDLTLKTTTDDLNINGIFYLTDHLTNQHTAELLIGLNILKGLPILQDLETGELILKEPKKKLKHKKQDPKQVFVIDVPLHVEERGLSNEQNYNKNKDNIHKVNSPQGDIKIGTTLKEEEKTELFNLINTYQDIFAHKTKKVSVTSKIKHVINTNNHPPISQKPYKLSLEKRSIVRKHVQELLNAGLIRKSRSPWASPVVLVSKKTGDTRLCVDYRKLNQITLFDSFPLHNIEDILTFIGPSNYFTSLDLKSGYYQIPINEADAEKTAFVTPEGLWEFKVMSMGLKTAPLTFQRLINEALDGLLNTKVLVYLDDILIFSSTFEDHLATLEEVFKRLKEYNLQLNLVKCLFGLSEITYLGFTFNKHGMTPDPSNITCILNCSRPLTVKQLLSFLGMASFYRKFIPGFSSIAKALIQLTKKDQPFIWGEEQEKAFNELKTKLTTYPVLALYQRNRPTQVRTDASASGLGAVLLQQHQDKWYPVCYASRTLVGAEVRYATTDLEATAVIFALKKFEQYLEGIYFTIVTDHHALIDLLNKKNISPRHTRWALRLQQFNFNIIYKSGKINHDADYLSRHPMTTEQTVEAEFEDEDKELVFLTQQISTDPLLKKLLSKKLVPFVKSGINCFMIEQPLSSELYQPNPPCVISHDIKYYQENDNKLKQLKHQIQHAHLLKKTQRKIVLNYYKIKDDIVYRVEGKQLRAVVPQSLKSELLQAYHDNNGHFSNLRTYNALKINYYWRQMAKDIKEYIKSCAVCQLVNKHPLKHLPLQTIGTERPFQRVGMDFMGPIACVEQDGTVTKKHILMCIDYFTKWLTAKVTDDQNTETVTQFLLEDVFCKFGTPESVITDNASYFSNEEFNKFISFLGITKLNIAPYHPEANGQIERANCTIKQIISKLILSHPDQWFKFVQIAVFAYNTTPQKVTSYSPYYLMYVKKPRLPIDILLRCNFNSFDNYPSYINSLEICWKEAKENAIIENGLHRSQYRTYYDINVGEIPSFQIGDKVLIQKKKIDSYSGGKFVPLYDGPYIVNCQINNSLYLVTRADKQRNVYVHVSKMKKYHDRQPAPPELEIFVIETKKNKKEKTSSEVTSEKLVTAIAELVIKSMDKKKRKRKKKSSNKKKVPPNDKESKMLGLLYKIDNQIGKVTTEDNLLSPDKPLSTNLQVITDTLEKIKNSTNEIDNKSSKILAIINSYKESSTTNPADKNLPLPTENQQKIVSIPSINPPPTSHATSNPSPSNPTTAYNNLPKRRLAVSYNFISRKEGNPGTLYVKDVLEFITENTTPGVHLMKSHLTNIIKLVNEQNIVRIKGYLYIGIRNCSRSGCQEIKVGHYYDIMRIYDKDYFIGYPAETNATGENYIDNNYVLPILQSIYEHSNISPKPSLPNITAIRNASPTN